MKPERWAYSVGVFNPLTITVWRNVEVQTQPLLFLVSANAIVRVPHLVPDASSAVVGWRVTGEYGFSQPTLAMRLSQGFLFPAWKEGGGRIGWSLAPRAGVVASHAARTLSGESAVVTFRFDLTMGIPLSHTDAKPLDAPAPLDLLLDPVLRRYRARVGALWDSTLGKRWRARAYGDLYIHGLDEQLQLPSGSRNLTSRLGVGVDLGLGANLLKRLTIGVAWWNADQHAIDPITWQAKRSNDVWPTLDFIWDG